MAWKKFSLLGAGSYGSVYLAVPLDNSYYTFSLVAVKSADDDRRSSYLQVEANFLQELKDCPYVVQGFGSDVSVEDGRKVYNLLLEYASGGSFDKMIKIYNGNMSESLIASYTYMLLKGLSSIHDKEIVHCDLKPQNILAFPLRGITLLKIADFGLSMKLLGNADVSGKMRGTALYAAPESVLCGLNAKARDIWALGCIVVEMITGRPLWSYTRKIELLRQIAHTSPRIPENISEDAKDFLKRCLDRNYTKRWTAKMLLDHPFIVKNLESSSAGTYLRQVVCPISKPWVCSEGMFSTPLQVQSSYDHQVYRPYELFPERSRSCFPLTCGAFGRF